MAVMGGHTNDHLVMQRDFSHAIQFSFIFDWRAPSFNGMLRALSAQDVTIVAISFLENFETTIARCVVNYPDIARRVAQEQIIHYHETTVLPIELDSASDMVKVSNTLFSAEIKIHYLYPFLTRPRGKVGLVLQTENNAFAANILASTGIQIISQDDIAR
ncbi:MAG: hypothetical protein LBI81_02035 [Puniceicoccales bacterium]|jgi:hypothetical protein|nr:hypothetical protein [Puniceicoccales bacterium]